MPGADVFNLASGETSLQFVTVGNPGNAADTTVESDSTTGYGSVAYDYKMGAYDVTVAQYVQFLNAVATTADTYGLYNSNMEALFGGLDNIGITQIAQPGSYTYSFSDSPDPQAGNCPCSTSPGATRPGSATGLPTASRRGPKGRGPTETGAYTLGGDT